MGIQKGGGISGWGGGFLKGRGERTGTAGRQGAGVLASPRGGGNETTWREEATLGG